MRKCLLPPKRVRFVWTHNTLESSLKAPPVAHRHVFARVFYFLDVPFRWLYLSKTCCPSEEKVLKRLLCRAIDASSKSFETPTLPWSLSRSNSLVQLVTSAIKSTIIVASCAFMSLYFTILFSKWVCHFFLLEGKTLSDSWTIRKCSGSITIPVDATKPTTFSEKNVLQYLFNQSHVRTLRF